MSKTGYWINVLNKTPILNRENEIFFSACRVFWGRVPLPSRVREKGMVPIHYDRVLQIVVHVSVHVELDRMNN